MSEITIKTPKGDSFTGYLAKPKTAGAPVPGVILIQEIFGVNANMRDLANKMADLGYLALCPDLFWRQEPGVQLTDKTEAHWARAFELYKGFNEASGVADLSAAVDHLRQLPECSGKVGSMGYCLGGKLAYLMATRGDPDCNVGYYGVGIETALNEAAAITKPLMLHIATADKFVPPEAQTAIQDLLATVPLATVHRYDGCDHAFARVGGEHYDAAAAKLADDRTAAFLRQHLT
jgi:carboxymethylenebutenolidase